MSSRQQEDHQQIRSLLKPQGHALIHPSRPCAFLGGDMQISENDH